MCKAPEEIINIQWSSMEKRVGAINFVVNCIVSWCVQTVLWFVTRMLSTKEI